MTTKTKKGATRPVKSMRSTTNGTGQKKSLNMMQRRVRHATRDVSYRKDLTKAAMRRAAAIIRSPKPLPKRKGAKDAAKKE